MAENTKKESSLPPYDLNAKWDACIDLTLRRFAYSSLAGAFGGLLFFRSPVTRWASVAFGAGVGIGTAYTECSNIFDGSTPKWTPPRVSTVPPLPSNQLSSCNLLMSMSNKECCQRETKDVVGSQFFTRNFEVEHVLLFFFSRFSAHVIPSLSEITGVYDCS
ncbi:MICOS complex subunit Mic10 [Cinnamomum micranthum f. kanehirae]|uniref:MICOS complex subunit Mic10 n=1 Tax=Cinnamomum micranthum f. kanehirae TaxID=337451 RepID=A0A3S3MV47_9MAGN|nr:MICOS complex subunit Mic10 [Cinnamomum micranthum f. kanehirae]